MNMNNTGLLITDSGLVYTRWFGNEGTSGQRGKREILAHEEILVIYPKILTTEPTLLILKL